MGTFVRVGERFGTLFIALRVLIAPLYPPPPFPSASDWFNTVTGVSSWSPPSKEELETTNGAAAALAPTTGQIVDI